MVPQPITPTFREEPNKAFCGTTQRLRLCHGDTTGRHGEVTETDTQKQGAELAPPS
jgi:hypothetical protein